MTQAIYFFIGNLINDMLMCKSQRHHSFSLHRTALYTCQRLKKARQLMTDTGDNVASGYEGEDSLLVTMFYLIMHWSKNTEELCIDR